MVPRTLCQPSDAVDGQQVLQQEVQQAAGGLHAVLQGGVHPQRPQLQSAPGGCRGGVVLQHHRRYQFLPILPPGSSTRVCYVRTSLSAANELRVLLNFIVFMTRNCLCWQATASAML